MKVMQGHQIPHPPNYNQDPFDPQPTAPPPPTVQQIAQQHQRQKGATYTSIPNMTNMSHMLNPYQGVATPDQQRHTPNYNSSQMGYLQQPPAQMQHHGAPHYPQIDGLVQGTFDPQTMAHRYPEAALAAQQQQQRLGISAHQVAMGPVSKPQMQQYINQLPGNLQPGLAYLASTTLRNTATNSSFGMFQFNAEGYCVVEMGVAHNICQTWPNDYVMRAFTGNPGEGLQHSNTRPEFAGDLRGPELAAHTDDERAAMVADVIPENRSWATAQRIDADPAVGILASQWQEEKEKLLLELQSAKCSNQALTEELESARENIQEAFERIERQGGELLRAVVFPEGWNGDITTVRHAMQALVNGDYETAISSFTSLFPEGVIQMDSPPTTPTEPPPSTSPANNRLGRKPGKKP